MASGEQDGGASSNSLRASPAGSDATDAPTAPTVASPALTPTALAESDVMSGADTAVASKSEAMAAVRPSDIGADAGDAADAADADDADEGADTLVDTVLLDRYRVTRKIGQGGMGAVYEATHTGIGKRVAIKVLLDKHAKKDPIVARLEQEARLASSIGHEHIIDITDIGRTADSRTFVVMEYLEGESLGELLERDGTLEEQRIIDIARQVVSALGAAHLKGVVHRDIKPDNVFLLQRRGKDFVKVVDFGISKAMQTGDEPGHQSPRLTQTGMVLGTPLYMSPEQARGDDDLDHRIDVYAVGVLMYEMVTGEVPFLGNNYLSILTQVINDEPAAPSEARPDLSAEFEAVMMKALAKDRANRYQSMDSLYDDLSVLVHTDGTTTGRGRISAERYRPKGAGRSRLRMLGWAAGIAVLIAAIVVTVSVMMGGTGEQSAAAMPLDAGVTVAADAAPVAKSPQVAPVLPAMKVVKLAVKTQPPGAKVFLGDRLMGTSPLSFPAEKVNREMLVIVELAGYHDGKATVNPYLDGDSERPITIRLRKVKKGTRRRTLRKSSGTSTGKSTTGKSDSNASHTKRGDDDTAHGELSGDPYKKKP